MKRYKNVMTSYEKVFKKLWKVMKMYEKLWKVMKTIHKLFTTILNYS